MAIAQSALYKTMAQSVRTKSDGQRQRWHAEYISRILRIIQQELEALEYPENNQNIEEIAEELGLS